jgi:hypothetical protein
MLTALTPTTPEGKDYFPSAVSIWPRASATPRPMKAACSIMHAVMEDAAKRGLVDIDLIG